MDIRQANVRSCRIPRGSRGRVVKLRTRQGAGGLVLVTGAAGSWRCRQTWSQPVAEMVVFSNDLARRQDRPRRLCATSTRQACRMGRKTGCLSSHPTLWTSRSWAGPRYEPRPYGPPRPWKANPLVEAPDARWVSMTIIEGVSSVHVVDTMQNETACAPACSRPVVLLPPRLGLRDGLAVGPLPAAVAGDAAGGSDPPLRECQPVPVVSDDQSLRISP